MSADPTLIPEDVYQSAWSAYFAAEPPAEGRIAGVVNAVYAAGLAAGRTAAAEDLTAIFEKKAQEYRSQPGNWGEACDWDAAATICEDYADAPAARVAENGADR